MFGQERKNETRDLVVLLVQGEVAGVARFSSSNLLASGDRWTLNSTRPRKSIPPVACA